MVLNDQIIGIITTCHTPDSKPVGRDPNSKRDGYEHSEIL